MRRIIIAIATNTLGAAIIVIGARLPNLTAAIATTAAGSALSFSGAAYAIVSCEMEIAARSRLSKELAENAKLHLEGKQELLSELEDLRTRVIEAEDQYATIAALVNLDEDIIEKLDQAELN